MKIIILLLLLCCTVSSAEYSKYGIHYLELVVKNVNKKESLYTDIINRAYGSSGVELAEVQNIISKSFNGSENEQFLLKIKEYELEGFPFDMITSGLNGNNPLEFARSMGMLVVTKPTEDGFVLLKKNIGEYISREQDGHHMRLAQICAIYLTDGEFKQKVANELKRYAWSSDFRRSIYHYINEVQKIYGSKIPTIQASLIDAS